MNRAYFLNSDALRRVLTEEQFWLPLSHTMALHAIARLHGFKSWNAAAASTLDQTAVKNRAKVLKDQLGATADFKSLPPEKLTAICSALNAMELEPVWSKNSIRRIFAGFTGRAGGCAPAVSSVDSSR